MSSKKRKGKRGRNHKPIHNVHTSTRAHDEPGVSDENQYDKTKRRNKEKLLTALEDHKGLILYACKQANVCRKTYYNYRDEDPEFAEAADLIIDYTNDLAEHTLLSIMQNGENENARVNASKTWLAAKAKNRGYGTEKRDVDAIVNMNATIQDVRFEIPENHTGPGSESPLPPGWEAATGGG